MPTKSAPKTIEAYADEVRALSIPDFVYDPENGDEHDLREVSRHPSVIVKGDVLVIHNDDGTHFLNYYGEFDNGAPWIHPVLTTWVEGLGLYFEWRDPGAITCRPLDR